MRDGLDADVIVVGYGPVGQVLAILLAARGHRVAVVERWPDPYLLPRATSFDGETARTLAGAGVGASLAEIGEPADGYDWCDATGRTLLSIGFTQNGRYGWPDATTMHQPALEAVLHARAGQLSTMDVRRGRTATAITQDGDRAELTYVDAAGAGRVTASWIVGCDGANSFVRDGMGVGVTDLGFSYDWLLCDVALTEPRTFEPTNMQICDPARPTTVVASGPGRRRWEFMRLPGESIDELNRSETAWQLLKSFDVTPENAVLNRHTVYRFRAAWADEWRRGRVLLAGDAAHSMPPFTGQGMCSGIRDVLNLTWKLDLVLRGTARDTLLDSYTAERLPHVQQTIDTAVKLGRMVCVTEESAAAARDAAERPTHRGTAPATHPLRSGLLYKGITATAAPPAGELIPQGRITANGTTDLFDNIVGTGFVLLGTEEPTTALDETHRRFLTAIGAHVVHFASHDQAPGTVIDTDGVYLGYLRSVRARFLLVRPDYHIFGAARTSREVTTLIDQLRRLMTT
jgi:flavoprotein hydroxylase